MMAAPDTSASQQAFYDDLVTHELILPSGVPGVFGRGPVFEDILARFNDLISALAAPDGAQLLHFPPVIPRTLLEQTGVLTSFPHLAGTIFSFEGDDAQHRQLQEHLAAGQDWSGFEKPTDVALTSAACYPVYPTCSGTLPTEGRLIDVTSYCFRHEPSGDPARLQMFRMREHVRLGTPATVVEWRDTWLTRGSELLRSLGLLAAAVPASDPFFGRAGRMLVAFQREQKLKVELVVPITSVETPTAVMSFNYHQDHFASKFKILTGPDTLAHTACLGFGMERIVMALLQAHGFQVSDWPDAVRRKLWA